MSQSVNIVSAEDSSMNVDDSMAAEDAFDLTASASAPQVLGGLILPPEVLRKKLPEVASAVNNAIRSSTRIRRVPSYLQAELAQQRKRQHTPTYNKHAQHIATQKKIMLVEPVSPQIEEKRTQNLRQYQRKFNCSTCNLQFPTKEDLHSHNQLKQEHKCEDCKTGYCTKEQLQDHKCMFCKICNKLYSYYGTYITHFRKYHYKPTFTCFACNEHFNNEDILTVYRESYVAFYAHCPKCDRRFTSFLCYECGEAYPNLDGLSKHSHGQGLEHKGNICNAEFEHVVQTPRTRTHSSTVKTLKTYSKVPKRNIKATDIAENQEIKEPDTKVEENVKEIWFDNVKETYYKADSQLESGLEQKGSKCNAEFDCDLVLAPHMQTHSSTVKSYTKVPKRKVKAKDIAENQEITEPDTKVEEINAIWFDNVKETYYKADGQRETLKDLENDWSADAVKEEPDDIKKSEIEIKIEVDELVSINTGHRQTNTLDESTFDKRKIDEVKKEPENWYEFHIEPIEIEFVPEVQIQKHQRTIIIGEDTKNRNEIINNSLNIVKVEPSDSKKETGLVESSTSTGPCLVKLEPPEVSDAVVSSESCLEQVKTECT